MPLKCKSNIEKLLKGNIERTCINLFSWHSVVCQTTQNLIWLAPTMLVQSFGLIFMGLLFMFLVLQCIIGNLLALLHQPMHVNYGCPRWGHVAFLIVGIFYSRGENFISIFRSTSKLNITLYSVLRIISIFISSRSCSDIQSWKNAAEMKTKTSLNSSFCIPSRGSKPNEFTSKYISRTVLVI